MSTGSYSLTELAEATGLEERTIRSYIERGLLPGAHARGRASSYSDEHLARLNIILSLRRARPNIGLSEIRIFLQNLSPDQIKRFADGEITATNRVTDTLIQTEGTESGTASNEDIEMPRTTDWARSAASLTGVERLVCILREVSGQKVLGSTSKVEGWQRIAVTPDIELSVRAGFDETLVAAFRELADLLRHLLQHTDALSPNAEEQR
jgi:DNA-binding transcriptional MerR regulator